MLAQLELQKGKVKNMLKTEMRNEKTKNLDRMSTLEMINVFNEENYNAVKAVENESLNIAKAIEFASKSLNNGGRIFYIGAGTSGRLGVIDAAECPPTFGVGKEVVIGIIAGGEKCMTSAAENEEDNAETGILDFMAYNPTQNDTLIGISASGGAAYVLGAIRKAKEIGLKTVGVTSNESLLSKEADVGIVCDTGAEILTGSTRLKAGTAQKLVLNMISTCAMVNSGKVYENMMVNLSPTNIKLRARVIRITSNIIGENEEVCEKLLEENDWNIRKAVTAYKE